MSSARSTHPCRPRATSVAIYPGSIVNPTIIEAQVQSAVALGFSPTLVEELADEDGEPITRNFDDYAILRRIR